VEIMDRVAIAGPKHSADALNEDKGDKVAETKRQKTIYFEDLTKSSKHMYYK